MALSLFSSGRGAVLASRRPGSSIR